MSDIREASVEPGSDRLPGGVLLQLAPFLVPVAEKREPFPTLPGGGDRDPGPRGDVAPRRGPERAEV